MFYKQRIENLEAEVAYLHKDLDRKNQLLVQQSARLTRLIQFLGLVESSRGFHLPPEVKPDKKVKKVKK